MNNESLWKKGQITITTEGSEELYTWEAKVYDEGSKYGINGGRVSKLWVQKDGVVVCNYDRGWDIEPASYAEWQVVNYITNVVYASEDASFHKDVVSFVVNDWLEAEFSDEGVCELQEMVRKLGVESLYNLYMDSDEVMFDYEHISDIIKNLLAAKKAADGGKYE